MCHVSSRLDRYICLRVKQSPNDFGVLQFLWVISNLVFPSNLFCRQEDSCDSTGNRCSVVGLGSDVRTHFSWKPVVTGQALGTALDWPSPCCLVCLWWTNGSTHCLCNAQVGGHSVWRCLFVLPEFPRLTLTKVWASVLTDTTFWFLRLFFHTPTRLYRFG